MARAIALAVLVTLLAVPGAAHAQRRGRSGPAMTPYGPVANPTQSAEWRQAGGNPIIYQQIMEQKLLAAQQKEMQKEWQALQKQKQAYDKWLKEQKTKKDKGQPVDPAYQQMLDREAQYKAAVEARAARATAKVEAAKAKKAAARKKAEASKTSGKDNEKKASVPAEK